MKTEDLLKKALDRLDKMSSEEVQRISKEKGIVVPEEPKLTDWLNHFVFDLDGFFKEIVNSKPNPKWFDRKFLERQSINVKDKMSHVVVAHSSYNKEYNHNII